MLLAKLAFLQLILFVYSSLVSADQEFGFTFSGFQSKNISLDGSAILTPNGLLKLTNTTSQIGQAFYTNQINFKNKYSSKNGSSISSASSFSTTFVFAIVPNFPGISAHGISFVIAPTKGLPNAAAYEFFGVFNITSNGNASNHVFAVELDTIQNRQFEDINDNHVGIDINGLDSRTSKPAAYFDDTNNEFHNL